MSIHHGNPDNPGRCQDIYNFLLVRAERGATSIELAHAGGRQQVAAHSTISELRAWAREAGKDALTFPCEYAGRQEGRKVYRYWIKDYPKTVQPSQATREAGYSWDGDQAVLVQ